MGAFFCKKCGVKIASLAVCSGEVRMDVELDLFDQKTGKRWVRHLFIYDAKCDSDKRRHSFTLYDVDDDYTDFRYPNAYIKNRLRNTKWRNDNDYIYVLEPPLRNEKWVILGRCGATFCPHCGYEQRQWDQVGSGSGGVKDQVGSDLEHRIYLTRL